MSDHDPVIVDITPTYDFSGFLGPVSSLDVNTVKAGQAVPVQFSLGEDYGLGVIAAGSPTSRRVACDYVRPDRPDRGGGDGRPVALAYDPATGVYTYSWKTDKSWAGTCRELTLTLIDDSVHTALFAFTR